MKISNFLSGLVTSGLVAVVVGCGGDYKPQTITQEREPGYFRVEVDGWNYFSFRAKRSYYRDRVDCDLEVYSPTKSLHFVDWRCDDKVDEVINHGQAFFRVNFGERQFAKVDSSYAHYKTKIETATGIDLDAVVRGL